MYDQKIIAFLTGLGQEQRTALGELYARLEEDLRIEVHHRQRELFKEWLAHGRFTAHQAPEASYAAFLEVLKLLWIEQAGNGSQPIKPRKQHKHRLRAALEKKYLGELVRLREEEQLSWRQLSEYFKKEFKKSVSHTYLKRIYEEHLSDRNNATQLQHTPAP